MSTPHTFRSRCSECFEIVVSKVWPPKACPNCGHTEEPVEDRVCAPSIRSPRTESIDGTYREIEAASERRVEQAAEAAGCAPSEMSSLKITNLNDRRDAEMAAIPVSNAVTQQMDYVNAKGGNLGWQQGGAAHADAVRSGAVVVDGRVVARGVEPNAGFRAVGNVQKLMAGG